MLDFKFLIAKYLAFLIAISSFVGGTYWVCDRIVGGADPIMHPFIYMGPIALLVGGGAGALAVMVINAYQQRLNRISSESQSNRSSQPK